MQRKRNIFNFKKDIRHIEGWLTENEGTFLYHQAKKTSNKLAIVEVGSWKGKSTVCLAKGAKAGKRSHSYAVDPHTGSKEHRKKFGKVDTFQSFKNNISSNKLEEFVTPIRKPSTKAAKTFNKKIGLMFIDGAHEYKNVMADINAWFPKVSHGGIIAFHDSWRLPGVHIATALLILTSKNVKNPKLVDKITYFQKVENNTKLDRIKNMYFILYRSATGIRGTINTISEEINKLQETRKPLHKKAFKLANMISL